MSSAGLFPLSALTASPLPAAGPLPASLSPHPRGRLPTPRVSPPPCLTHPELGLGKRFPSEQRGDTSRTQIARRSATGPPPTGDPRPIPAASGSPPCPTLWSGLGRPLGKGSCSMEGTGGPPDPGCHLPGGLQAPWSLLKTQEIWQRPKVHRREMSSKSFSSWVQWVTPKTFLQK